MGEQTSLREIVFNESFSPEERETAQEAVSVLMAQYQREHPPTNRYIHVY
jgi:hypothetical protein